MAMVANKAAPKRSSSSGSVNSDYEVGTSGKRKSRRRKQKISRSVSSVTKKTDSIEFDAEEYLDKRHMTPTQERFNAITMIPGMIYCVYYLMTERWLTSSNEKESFRVEESESSEWAGMAREAFGSEVRWTENVGCLDSHSFPYLTVLPPLTVVAAAVAILVHSPCSMLYHWKYATSLHTSKRIPHWSRRLDNVSIHFASVLASYSTSGRMDYFLLNVVFNLDCAYRQFEEEVRPRRNLVRLASSILLYLLPVMVYGHYDLVFQFFAMFGTCAWLFVGYPLGGWSHGIFHLVDAFLPYLVITSAMRLESSQLQISLAATCAGMTTN